MARSLLARHTIEEIDLAGLERILGADDPEAVAGNELFEESGAVAELVAGGADVGAAGADAGAAGAGEACACADPRSGTTGGRGSAAPAGAANRATASSVPASA